MIDISKVSGRCNKCGSISDKILKVSFHIKINGEVKDYHAPICNKCIFMILEDKVGPFGIPKDVWKDMYNKLNERSTNDPFVVHDTEDLIDFMNNYSPDLGSKDD